MKIFLFSKDWQARIKRQARVWEKIFANGTSGKMLVTRICKPEGK